MADKEEGIFRNAFPSDIENYATHSGLQKMANIGTDGISQLIQEKINDANDDEFDRYMEYIDKTCDDSSILGTSLHGLYWGRKL